MRKYLRDGQEVEVIKKIKDGFLVQDVFYSEDEYENEYVDDSKTYFIEKVFDKAPELKYTIEVNRLEEKVNELHKQKEKLQAEIEKATEENKNKMKKFNKFSELKNLNMFIDGEITHFALLKWERRIVTFDEFVCKEDHTGNSPYILKLLTLFGKSKGDLEWRINEYKDGSGSWKTAVPCSSFEEARQELQKYIDAEIETDDTSARYIIECAKEYNLRIDKNYIKKYKDKQKEEYRRKVVECKEELKEAQKKLKESK